MKSKSNFLKNTPNLEARIGYTIEEILIILKATFMEHGENLKKKIREHFFLKISVSVKYTSLSKILVSKKKT